MNAVFLGAVMSALLGSAEPVEVQIPSPRLSPRISMSSPLVPVAAFLASPPAEAYTRNLPEDGFNPGRTGPVLVLENGLEVDYRVFTLFARPGETLALSFREPVSLEHDSIEHGAAPSHAWTAPADTGLERLVLRGGGGREMTLNVLVMEPASGTEVGDYRLGAYPDEPYRGDPAYLAPDHFARVEDGLFDLPVSPHFTLGQFICKQQEDGPHYLVLSPILLAKLEVLLEAVNEEGWRASGFSVLSGYRTPAYNASIGNGRYSRHIYGGAADIFIDEDGDGRMDDLNGDGRFDRADAAALYDLVERLSREEGWDPLIGGLGEYGPNGVHGGFVHVDERGWRARWGRPTH